MTNNVFRQKGKNSTTTKQTHKIPCQSRESIPGLIAPPFVRVVKLYNCFNVLGRNLNKQSQICGLHISTM